MSQVSSVVNVVAQLLRGAGGLQTKLDEAASLESAPPVLVGSEQVITRNIAAEIVAKTSGINYPAIYVYCDKISNQLREKFRTFSGAATVVIEVRASSDRAEDIDNQINVLVDGVTGTLDQNRGDWGGGVFYGGGYEVEYGAVKQGGKNLIQAVKVLFSLEISKS